MTRRTKFIYWLIIVLLLVYIIQRPPSYKTMQRRAGVEFINSIDHQLYLRDYFKGPVISLRGDKYVRFSWYILLIFKDTAKIHISIPINNWTGSQINMNFQSDYLQGPRSDILEILPKTFQGDTNKVKLSFLSEQNQYYRDAVFPRFIDSREKLLFVLEKGFYETVTVSDTGSLIKFYDNVYEDSIGDEWGQSVVFKSDDQGRILLIPKKIPIEIDKRRPYEEYQAEQNERIIRLKKKINTKAEIIKIIKK